MLEIKDIIRYQGSETIEILSCINGKYDGVLESDWQGSDQLIVKNLLAGLGETDTAGQLNFCDGVLSDINRNLMDAEKERNEKAKLYTTLGISAGLAVSIIIF